MVSESTTGAVYNGGVTLLSQRRSEKPRNSNPKIHINDNQNLKAVRLEAFMAAPPSAIVALDTKPQDIQAAHEIRIAIELRNIVPSLPRV
ncbi:hypothetical protein F4776DRAFT_667894 [Hypoxylon sp. NC0597]|nr:hypothetical protein F4776DRAFT_667894 [Hypoxylon sp. NC0597]